MEKRILQCEKGEAGNTMQCKQKRYHFIINPVASSGKAVHIWNKVERILKEEGILYWAHILQNPAEAEMLVRNLTGEYREESKITSLHNIEEAAAAQEVQDCHLVVLGGDGTLNAVLNGIASFEHTILSCIRTGSGNDFARNMGIHKDAEKALHGILHHTKEFLLDYGIAGYLPEHNPEERKEGMQNKRFLISSGAGYDADICEEVSRSRLKEWLNKIYIGKLVYVAIGVKQIFTRKTADAVVYMDEKEPIPVSNLFFAVSMIHEREGGGVPFCPDADATDGLLDICLVRNMPKWKLLLAVAMVYAKKHVLFRNVTLYRCKKIIIQPQKPQWLHLDGETPCKTEYVTMECRKGLRFLM